jgi:hypothetical protein
MAQTGGGVLVEKNGIFTMSGGEISGNMALVGSGIAIRMEIFIMGGEARIHTNNTVSLTYLGPNEYSSITIGGNFTGPAGPVAKLDLFAEFDPASSWPGKAILKPVDGYNGNISTIKDRFILGNFIHLEGRGTAESPYTFPATPITGYEIGADGTLQASKRQQ